MLTDNLKMLYTRDLGLLKQELELYKKEENIWLVAPGIANCAGNLCLHLVGNLNTYIGAVLGNTGYIRERPLEFSLKDVPLAELLLKVEDTIAMINSVMPGISESQLNSEFPLTVFTEKTSTAFMLMHLAKHLGYHLGQVNYHRRLLDN